MNKKIIIFVLLILMLVGGCFKKEVSQKGLSTNANNIVKNFIFIYAASSVFKEENGRWPDSTESLKAYSHRISELSDKIDWENYKIQAISDIEGEKIKIEYHSGNNSISTVFSFTSKDNITPFDSNTMKQHLKEMLEQKLMESNITSTEFFKNLNEKSTGLSVSKITKDDAIKIARRKLQEEPFAKDIDVNRTKVYYGKSGHVGEEITRWAIDFARKCTEEIEPGRWSRGYIVVLDPNTGSIIEAVGYKR